MSSYSQPGLALDPLLVEIDIFLRTRVHNLNVNLLLIAWSDIRSDDYEGIRMCGVPYAFGLWIARCWEIEFDC